MSVPVSPLSLLVGRERELAILRERLADAIAGHRSLVLIGGEAGIGKTALAQALCRDAEAGGALVLVGRSYDLTETPPYGPWVELFGRCQPADTMPTLPAAFAEGGVIGPVANQAALFRQVADFFAALSARCPLILLLDDMHWADPASLDLLRVLARDLTPLPLLLIATYRADEVTNGHPLHPLLPALVREADAERVDLRPLDDVAVRALVSGRYHLPPDDTDRLVADVQARAEGNALFVVELLRSLEEGGTLRREEGRWLLGELGETAVPPLLRQVIDGRTARLDAECRRLLAIAAVIGHEAPLDLWAAVAEVEDEAVFAAGEQGTEARLLTETPDGAGVRFAHALIREALYEGMRASQRRRMHLRIADVLIALTKPDPDTVAAHLRRARDGRAADWLVRAGERAARSYAWLTAADRFAAALEFAGRDGADPAGRGWLLYHHATLRAFAAPDSFVASLDEAERIGRGTGDRGLAALSMFWRGALRCIIGDRRRGVRDMEAGVAARRALTGAERANLPALPIPHAVRDDTDGQGMLVQWLATVGRYAEAREIAERALGEATERRDRPFVGDVHLGLAQAYAGLGLPEESRGAFGRARGEYRSIGHDFMAGINAANELRWVLPFIADEPAAVSGLLDEMDAAMAGAGESPSEHLHRYPRLIRDLLGDDWREAHRQADAHGGTFGFRQTAWQLLAPILRVQGNASFAWKLVDETLPEGAATEPGNAWLPGGLTHQRLAAALAMDAGDAEAARAWLAAHDRWVAWSGSPIGRADGALAWASYHRATGDPQAAFRQAQEALALAGTPRQPLVLIAAHRLLGELALEVGRHEDAARHLAEALPLAEASAAPHERVLTLLALAELYIATGDDPGARAGLAEARAVCERLGAGPALVRANAIAARLDASAGTLPRHPAGLTMREVEVLRLVAAGKTNREIAGGLFLSPPTVNIHVTHILAKTDSANRTEAAAFAHRHGIA